MAINCSLVRRKQLQEIKEGLDKRFKHLSDPVIENWVRMWRTYNNTAADPTAEDINKMLADRADEMLNNTLNCFKSYASMFNSHLDEFNRMQQRGDINSIRTQDVNQKLREVKNPESIGLDKDYIVIEGMSNIVAENNETFIIDNANVDLIAVTPNGDVCIVNDSNVPAEVYEKQKEIINTALGPKFKGAVFGYTYSEDKGLTPIKDREYLASIPYNEKQKDAIEEATDFALNGKANETFMIEGKAGTGKTTIAKEVVYKYSKEFERKFGRRPSIMMMALAHKAKEVLDESLGNLKTEVPNISLSTIASALGKREKVSQKGEITFETDPNVVVLPIEEPDLIIIDESSMVSQKMLREVMDLKKSNAKVITLGDDGQLPPIEKDANTHSPTFDTKNKVQLFERVRQGEASPILPYADRFWEQGTSKTPNIAPFKIPLHDIVQPEGSLLVAKNRESVLNNLINAFKYAIKAGNYNYVKYIAYQNATVDSMNELIHNAVAGDRINPNTGFADGEFILFKKPFYKDKDLIAPTSYEATIIKQGNVYTDSKGFKCCNLTIKHKDEINTIPVIVRQDLANYNAYLKQEANKINEAAKAQSPRDTKRMWAQYFAYVKEHADIDFAYALTSHKSQGSTYNISITDLNDIGGVKGPDASTKNKSAYVGITRAKNVAVVLISNAVETTSRDFNDVNSKIQSKTLTESEITKDNSIPESNSSLTVKTEPAEDTPQSTDYMDSLVAAYKEEATNDMPTNITSVYSEMGFNADEGDKPSKEGIEEANKHFNDTQDMPSSMPEEENNEMPEEILQPQQFVNHSGGALGSDSYWGEIGEKYGVKQNHYYHNSKTPKGNVRQSEEDYKEGYDKAKKAAENMGRKWVEQYADLQARNWNQVKYADAIFAIGHLVKPGEKNKKGYIVKAIQVDGGTGYAVQMAMTENKPVYVFDQERNKWYKHIDGKWSESDVPTLTQNFAGIGTREINDNGKKAIEDVYAKTFNVPQQPTQQQTTILGPETTINIYAGTGENADLSNFAERPFKFNSPLTNTLITYNTVEGAFQAAKLGYTDLSAEEIAEIETKLMSTTGAEARKIGRSIKGLNTEEWDKNSSGIMKNLLKASFEQNPQALQRLLATGNATLTHTQDKSKWGTEFPKLLMEVRDELRNNSESGIPFTLTEESKGKQPIKLNNNKTEVASLKDEQEAAEAFLAQQRVAATNKITASDAAALGMNNDNTNIPDAIKPDADVEVIPTQSRRQEIKQVFTPAVRNELTTNVAEVFTEFLFEEIEEYKAELQNEQEQYRNANGKNDESIILKLEALEDKETCVPVYLEAKGVQNIIQRISETIDDRVSQYEEFAEEHPEQKDRALMLRDRVANAKTYLEDLLADASVQIEEATGTRLSFDNKNGVITATANEDSATEEINDTEVDDNEEGDSTIAGGSELIEGVKYRFVDPFALMSKEVKMMLSRIEMADANIGKDNNWDEDHFVYGWLGNERHMPVKQTYAILLDAFSKYVNKPEDFYYKDDNDEYHFPVLDILKEQHYWARFLERNLRQALAEDNREVLSKFYTAMRMDFITYDAIKHNDNDEVQSFSLNQKEKANGIMKETVANTVNGIRLTLNDVYTHDAETCINNAKSALERNKQIIEALNYIRTANVNDDLSEYIENAVTEVHNALAKLGIDIHPAIIRSMIANTRGQNTVKTPIVEVIERVNQIMQRISKNKSLNEADAKDNQSKISDFRNIVNNQRYDYSWLCRMFSDFSELNNESSFKSTDGKKNYQSYSTPNFMGDLVHTFTNYDSWKRKAESLSDDYFVGKQILKVKQSYDENEKSTAVWVPVGKNEKIKLQDKIDILVREYLMEKYGNKEWYYKKGKWRNSVLELFYCNASKIMSDGSLMSKKELIEIDGETYRDWNGSMISKSMLERYFKDNVTLNDIIRQDGSIMDHLNITSFNTPILADSPVCMLNMQERVCSEFDPENPDAEVLSRFRDIVKQEIDRIKLVKARKKAKASPIANFDKKGEEFCFFPSLNDGFFDKYTELETKASEETLNSVIDARIMGIIEDTLREERKLMNLEVIKSNSDFKTDEEAIKAYNAFVVNGMLARTALIELTTVDLAFYKDWTDFQKRFKEIYANGKKLDTNSRYGKKMERVIYLKDLTGMSRQFSKLKAILDKAVKAGEMKSYDRDNFLSKFRDINATDAQSFRTLSSLRAVMDMVGNWNKRQQRAFENLQQGIFNPQDLDIAWQTIKPYMFTIVDKNDGLGGKISVPHQNKNSEFLLLTMFNVIGSSTKSPMMAGLNRFMEKNDIDVATFESAVKAGCEGAIDISHSTVKDKNGKTKLDRWIDSHNDEWAKMLEDLKGSLKDEQKFNSMSNWDKYLQASMVQFDKGIISQEQYNERMDAQEPSEQEVYDMLEDNVFIKDDKGNSTSMPNPDVLHELPYDNYCIQQPTPEHLFDAEVIFGSQFRNLIIADLPDTEEFKKLKEDYIRAINMNLQESFDKVKKLFTGKNGLIKLQKKLLEQIKGNPKYGREIEAALELVEITDDYGNKRVDFNIPLDNPNTTIGMQELLLSVFKNQITKQHIKGAACVLVSNVGYTKELNIVYNEDGNKDSGVKHIECYLPAASKRFYQPFLKENADGSVELDYSKLPEDLKQGIGYRIPTESKYSMIPLYIKGFLPQQNGSAIMLPEEITTMAGSDFDIDKLFMILPEFYEKKTYDYKKAWGDFYNANPELNKAINKAQWNSFKENLKQLKETNPESADKYDFTKEFKDWFVKNSGIKKYEWVEGTKDRFNEWFDQNKDNYILKTEFKRVKDGFNSRAARNNLILSISHKILTSKEIAPQLLRAGNFDEAKMLARIASIIDNQDLLNAFMEKQSIALTEAEEAKIRQNFDDGQAVIERRKLLVKKTKVLLNQIMKDHNLKLVDSFFKKYVKQNNPLTLGGFISNHEQNMLGGKMIGIYANNTTQQAKYQNSGLRLKDEFVFTFNGRKIRECDLVKNFNEEYVSQNCAQFSAASVDNAKDPILKALYQNPDTANITGFLLRAGFTLQEASLIFAHPVFRNMYEQGKLTANAVKKEFDNANKARGLESVDITDYDFTSDELLQQILESRLGAEDVNSEEHQSGQIRFLGLLYKVLAGAEAINSLTMNSRSDSPNGAAKPRISMVDNQLFRIDQLNYSFNNPNFALTGVRNLVSNTMDESYIAESKTPMLQAFHSYGLASIPSLLQGYFVQYIPEVRRTVNALLEQSPRKNRDMLLQNFYQQLVEYALTNTDLFGTTEQSTLEEKRQYYIYDFPAEFLKVVASKPELKDSGLFKVLTVKEGDLRYTGNTNNPIAFQYLQDQMEDLLYSNDLELKKLATDLFMYSFYKEGLSYGGNSVGKLFSTSFLTSIPEYINTVRNVKVTAKNPEFMHKFVSQFLANNTEIACTSLTSVKRQKDSVGNIAINAKYAVNKNILGKGRTDEPMLYEYISIDGGMYVLRGVNNKKAIYSPAPTFNRTNTGEIKESYYNARSTVEAMVDNKIDDDAVKRNKQTGVKKSSYLDSLESYSDILEGNYSDVERSYYDKETKTNGNFLDDVPTQQEYPENVNAVKETLCKKE